MMAKEQIKYTVVRHSDSRFYDVSIYRKLDGEWKQMNSGMASTMTMSGGKRAAVRWIKKWAKGKCRQRSYMNIIEVDVRWNS
jgi:hypothetical protein